MAHNNHFFTVTITPPPRIEEERVIVEEEEEKVVLILAPFNPVPVLEFVSNTNVNSTKQFFVKNPSSHPMKIEFEINEPQSGITMDPEGLTLEGGQENLVSVHWKAPSKPFQGRFSVKPKVQGKKLPHLSVVCQALVPKKVKKSSNVSRKMKTGLKSCSGNEENDRRLTYTVSSKTDLNSRSRSEWRSPLRRVEDNIPFPIDEVDDVQPCNSKKTLPEIVISNDTGKNCSHQSCKKESLPLKNAQKTDCFSTEGLSNAVECKKSPPISSTPFRPCSSSFDADMVVTDEFAIGALNISNVDFDETREPFSFLVNLPTNRASDECTGVDYDELAMPLDLSQHRTFQVPATPAPQSKTFVLYPPPNPYLQVQRLDNFGGSMDNLSKMAVHSQIAHSSELRRLSQSADNIVVEHRKSIEKAVNKTFSKKPILEWEESDLAVLEDPFSKNQVGIHSEKWLKEREEELLRWLNGVLTPPSEWAGLEHHYTVSEGDIAVLWERATRAQASENVLPPSKETLAIQFHTKDGRLVALRKAATALLKNEEVKRVQTWLRAQIANKLFEVKNDMDLRKNQGCRVLIVQMLLRYNPLWLRIGLEAIFQASIPLTAINDFRGLIAFILKRIMHNEVIETKMKTQKKYFMKVENLKNEMNKYIMNNFLFIVFFLDLAKCRRLIPFDPCLFMKNAPVKASAEMLDEFIREFMKATGGLKKQMERNGYVLRYKQTALDEYDFSIISRLDLRDGIRLTRAVELILRKYTLSSSLRIPAPSLLQKVSNVETALTALKNEGFIIAGNITARDIAIGHKEKTLSLLWQILNKFIKLRYENAVYKVQIWWRHKSLFREIRTRIKNKKMRTEINAAIKIQALWKAYSTRKWFFAEKDKLLAEKSLIISSAILIQKWFRALICRRNFLKYLNCRIEAARKIQCRFKAYRMMKNFRNEFIVVKKAVIFVQRKFRANRAVKKCRTDYADLKSSVIFIQEWYRRTSMMRKQKHFYNMFKQQVVLIQQRFRAKKLGNTCYREYQEIRFSVIKIQKWYRACKKRDLQRKYFLTIKASALVLQRKYRAVRLMRVCYSDYEVKRYSAITIQRWYRACKIMQKERTYFTALKSKTILIQRIYRAKVLRNQLAKEYKQIKSSTVSIQRWYRACHAMKQARKEYLHTRHSVVKIQQYFRLYTCMKRYHTTYLRTKSSAIAIQNWYRRCSKMRAEREYFMTLRSSAVFIQRKFRSLQLTMHYVTEFNLKKSSAITIQHWFRRIVALRKDRSSYLTARSLVILMQRKVRANLKMKECLREYKHVKSSIIIIQTWYRACKQMKVERKKFLIVRSSAILLQRTFRSRKDTKLCCMEYRKKRQCIIKIQRWYRTIKLMRFERDSYLHTRKCIIYIQQYYRAKVIANEAMSEYRKTITAVVCIQRWVRACKQMQLERNYYRSLLSSVLFVQQTLRSRRLTKECVKEYRLKKRSVIAIQRWFQATRRMRIQRESFLLLRKNVIKVQRLYRANVSMRKAVSDYRKTLAAVVKIQNWLRASHQMQLERNHYLCVLKSIAFMQSKIKAKNMMRICSGEFKLKRQSATKIQIWFRATTLMNTEKKKYLYFKQCVIFIQKKYRAKLEGRMCFMEYVKVRTSTIKIQRWYRACRLKSLSRNHFISLRMSVIFIQRKFRAWRVTKQCTEEYKSIKSSAFVIQRWFRAVKVGENVRAHYLYTLKCIVFVQQTYRAKLEMRKCYLEYKRVKSAVICIQQWYRNCKKMLSDRKRYIVLKSSATLIQCRFRAFQLRKQFLFHYNQIIPSTIKIQLWYRSILEMRIQRKKYLVIKKSVLSVQRRFRLKVAERRKACELQKKIYSAILIQRKYRAYKLMQIDKQQFIDLKKAVVFVQSMFKAKLLSRQLALEYNCNVESAKVKPSWYKQCIFMSADHQDFLLLKKNIILIQRWYRSCRKRKLEMEQSRQAKIKQFEEIYRKRRREESAIKIQSWYRICRIKILEKSRIQLRSAVIIQTIWRAFIIRKKFRNLIEKAKSAAAQKLKHREVPLCENYGSIPINVRYLGLLEAFKQARGNLCLKYKHLNTIELLIAVSQELCTHLSLQLEFHREVWNSLSSSNRSIGYFKFCTSALNIFISLTLVSTMSMWRVMEDECFMDNLLDLMQKFISENNDLFCKGATIIWLLARRPFCAIKLSNDPNFLQRLNRFKTLCEKKMNKDKKVVPNYKPPTKFHAGLFDGVRPAQFQDKLFAIKTILNLLNKSGAAKSK